MKRKIVLLATGGTISCTLDERGAAVRTLTAADLAAAAPSIPGIEVHPVDAEPFSSWNVDTPTMLRLSRHIDELLTSADGLVVTHGTDTIEETAYFLDLAVRANQPVVVTGAMRNASLAGADGPRNIEAASLVAAHEGTVPGGYVVLGDEIHAAAEVAKSHSASPATFVTPWLGPLGTVEGRAVSLLRSVGARRQCDVQRADFRVPLLKVAAGMDDSLARAAVASSPHGIVIEGTGVGHLPATWLPPLRNAIHQGIPVVMTSRTGAGPVRAEYGGPGGGFDVRESGLINGGRLPGLKARIALICALGAGLRGDDIRAAFERSP